MSFVFFQDEESTFWLLVVLIERILYPNTYSETLEGCHIEMRALGKMIRAKLPVIWTHFRDIGVETQLFSTDWSVGRAARKQNQVCLCV
jgi:hypothetical protein